MGLVELEVRRIRNICEGRFSASKQLNVIIGPNGSGKTSLLEAIHLIGLGRSFRTPQARKFIQQGSNDAMVFGKVDTGDRLASVGVSKSTSGESIIRIDGANAESAASLAELLPLQVIAPGSHGLIEGEPQLRRGFLDWGLFHVEHHYLGRWREFRRILLQRNAALRISGDEREFRQWDAAFAEVGEQLTSVRARYVSELVDTVRSIYERLIGEESPDLQIVFRGGWSRDESLNEALQRTREGDRRLGFTGIGPQRADFRVLVTGRDAAESLSRGQNKLLVCALRLAQIVDLDRRTGKGCTLLLDDLSAELDAVHRELLINEIASMETQCFLTATDSSLIDTSRWNDARMFHVEHGVLTNVV